MQEMLSGRVTKERATIVLLLTAVVGLLGVLLCTVSGSVAGVLMRSDRESPGTAFEPPSTPEPSFTTRVPPTVRPTAPRATRVPEATSTATPPSTPRWGVVPPGEVVVAGWISLKVQGLTRPADRIVASANQFNPVAEPGNEYVLIETSITCLKSESEPCFVSPLINFRLIGAATEYTPEILLLDVPGLLEGGELQGGSTSTGDLAFEIDSEETHLTLMYETILGADRTFLAVP